MNNETMLAKKRGPKPSGVEKVVYYRRVAPSMASMLDKVLFSGPEPSLNAPPSKEAHNVTQYLTEISQLKAQNMACAENEDKLMKALEKLEARLERCSRATDDEKCLRWIQKYDELAAILKDKEES